MSVGMIFLTASAILVFFGAAQRALDKMYLTDRTALLLIALMFFGTLIPNIGTNQISISIGGAVIPVGICIYLLFKADTVQEKLRTIVGAILTGAIIYAISSLSPDEPEAIIIDPIYLNGIAGGLIAYLLGRSRRGAFVCGVLGVLIADLAVGIVNYFNGVEQTLVLGGGGAFDAVVLSGLLGVVLAELMGELIERFVRGNHPTASKAIQTIKRKEH